MAGLEDAAGVARRRRGPRIHFVNEAKHMPKSNLNKQSKRQRELAKHDKRSAKDEKRAQRKADARVERAVATGVPPPPVAPPSPTSIAAAAFIRSMKIRG
jgi:hypothetical protein